MDMHPRVRSERCVHGRSLGERKCLSGDTRQIRLSPSNDEREPVAVDGIDTIICERCGDLVHFSDLWQPVHYVEREATASEQGSYLIIGADRLLHRCEIGEG